MNLGRAIIECRQVYYTHKATKGGIKYIIKEINGFRCLIIKGTSPLSWCESKYSLRYGSATVNGQRYHKGYVEACNDLTIEIGVQKFDYIMGHSLGAAVAFLYRKIHNLPSFVVGLCPPKFCKESQYLHNQLFVTTTMDPGNLILCMKYPVFDVFIRSPVGIPHLTYTIEKTFRDLLHLNVEDVGRIKKTSLI